MVEIFRSFDPADLRRFRSHVDNKKSELSHLQKRKKEVASNLDYTKRRAEGMKKARAIIQTVAQETQKNLEYHISDPVTSAIRAVLPDEINFVAKMVQRRGKTECDLMFEEHGNEYKPLKGSGYGAVSIACFTERICFWSLQKNRPTFILDEPFRDVSPEFQHKVSQMIKGLSEKLGLQIIMVSHAEDINVAADRTWKTTKKNRVTETKVIG